MNIKSKYKFIAQKFVFVIISLCLALSLFACNDPKPNEPPEWATTYTLQSEETVNARLLEIYGSQEKMYLLGNTIQRMPCPKNGATMKFNMTYQVNEYAKLVLEDAVTEINEIFSVVNPNYKFAINYNPTQEDFNSEYSIRMNITDNFSSPETMGTANMSTGKYLGNFVITLKDTTLDDLRYLMLTFRHEFMHILGAGDAYKNEQAERTTVMQNYNKTTYRHYSSSDVAFIDAYYRNPKIDKTDAQIKSFIADYEKNNSHTQHLMLSKVLNKAIQNTKQELITQLQAKNYENSQELLSILQNNLNFDVDFGLNNIAFTELTYMQEHKPASTYYGSFNTQTQKYTHGKQTETMGSSQDATYTNFGNGLLFAMPGGTNNMLVFAKTGNYVLVFYTQGMVWDIRSYAVEFSNLQISLQNACTINK